MKRLRKMREKKTICGHISIFLVIFSIFVSVFSLQVKAGGEKSVSTLTKEESVYVYVKGLSEIPADFSVQIGNFICPSESLSVKKLTDLDVPMRTIILIDNSKSISSAYHEDIQKILTGLAESALEKEEIKIGTMADTITYLNDYTCDKEILRQSIKGLAYENQDTYLSGLLNNVIVELNRENTGIFTRIIVIADGADDEAVGYKDEEVRKLIEESSYPVYTIGTKEKKNDSQLENLFSFSRAASSEYYLLNGELQTESVVSGLAEDRKNICICINPDASLMDGSRKSILLKFNTGDGEVQLKTSAEMPFGDGVVPKTEKNGLNPESEEEESKKNAVPTMHITDENENKDTKKQNGISGIFAVTIVILAIIGLIMAAGIVLFFVIRNKKKQKEQGIQNQGEQKEPVPAPNDDDDDDGGHTILYDSPTEIGSPGKEGDEIPLWPKKYIVMKCVERPMETYKVQIQDIIQIGRGDKDINLNDDLKVSHIHCEIMCRGNMLSVKDCGSLNGTYYQNRRINKETPLVSGEVIKIGSYSYVVELIEE